MTLQVYGLIILALSVLIVVEGYIFRRMKK